MRTSHSILMIATLLICGCDHQKPSDLQDNPVETNKSTDVDSTLESQLTPISTIEYAFANNQSDLQVMVKGTVIKLLSDDVSGDKHQRMILKLANNQTLLIAHNIDIGQRVPAAALNKVIYVFGEYEWNAEGGVVHWTHNDPGGTHTGGWIQYNGVVYQ